MYYKTTITQKGQITIPKPLREYFKLRRSSKIILEYSENKEGIIVKPAPDILDLAGTFKPKKMKPILAARTAYEKKIQKSVVYDIFYRH